jgi:hypothetical protein
VLILTSGAPGPGSGGSEGSDGSNDHVSIAFLYTPLGVIGVPSDARGTSSKSATVVQRQCLGQPSLINSMGPPKRTMQVDFF